MSKANNLRGASVQELVERYRIAAAEEGVGLDEGNSRKAVKAADAIRAVFSELQARGQGLQLLGLLDDANPHVRLWAACHALDFAPEVAEAKLKALRGHRKAVVGLTAEMTLREWRKN